MFLLTLGESWGQRKRSYPYLLNQWLSFPLRCVVQRTCLPALNTFCKWKSWYRSRRHLCIQCKITTLISVSLLPCTFNKTSPSQLHLTSSSNSWSLEALLKLGLEFSKLFTSVGTNVKLGRCIVRNHICLMIRVKRLLFHLSLPLQSYLTELPPCWINPCILYMSQWWRWLMRWIMNVIDQLLAYLLEGRVCWRSIDMLSHPCINASKALIPFQGAIPAWEAFPKYSISTWSRANMSAYKQSFAKGCLNHVSIRYYVVLCSPLVIVLLLTTSLQHQHGFGPPFAQQNQSCRWCFLRLVYHTKPMYPG